MIARKLLRKPHRNSSGEYRFNMYEHNAAIRNAPIASITGLGTGTLLPLVMDHIILTSSTTTIRSLKYERTDGKPNVNVMKFVIMEYIRINFMISAILILIAILFRFPEYCKTLTQQYNSFFQSLHTIKCQQCASHFILNHIHTYLLLDSYRI